MGKCKELWIVRKPEAMWIKYLSQEQYRGYCKMAEDGDPEVVGFEYLETRWEDKAAGGSRSASQVLFVNKEIFSVPFLEEVLVSGFSFT